jgi:hypothetical protein
MKIIVTTVFFAVLFLFISSLAVFGDDEHGHARPLEKILEEIRTKQGIGPEDTIDPDKVSYEDLEEIGEAVMDIMHPDPKQHELMDEMMGGEGSESLTGMHRMMGYRYLSRGSVGRMGYGMMGPGMMGGMGGYGMMGPGMMGGMGGYGMMGPGMMGGMGGYGMMGSAMMGGPDYYLRIKDVLGLDSSQIDRLQRIRQKHAEAGQDSQSSLKLAYIGLQELLESEKVNMKEVERKVRDVERYRGDLMIAAIRTNRESHDGAQDMMGPGSPKWQREMMGPGTRGRGGQGMHGTMMQ